MLLKFPFHKINLLFISLLYLFNLSCNTTEPINDSLNLSVEDVSCTEAWLKLEIKNTTLPVQLSLYTNNGFKANYNISTNVTTLYVDSLLPNKMYTVKAQLSNNQNQTTSLQLTTLDTTSNNFTFETYEFGDGYSSSYFNDVWVFNENNIWAVGYISPEDTTINGVHITNPNIIKWDGQSWKIQPNSGTSSGIYGMWAADTSNIYFANGLVEKYEKGSYKYYDFSGMDFSGGRGIYRLWGNKNENIFGVGPAGTIVHFDGSKWVKIDFDQQWHFYEITGNKETGVAYAVAVNSYDDCIIVNLKNLKADIIYQKSVSEIKFYSYSITELNNHLYIPNIYSKSSIYRIDETTNKPELIYQIPESFGVEQSFAVSKNNIYYFGQDLSGIGVWLLHFNGVSYKALSIPSIDPDNRGSLHAIKDLAVSVGFTNNKAYLIKIKRTN